MSDFIKNDSTEGVLTITINRPEVRNAINYAVSVELAAAMEEFDSRPDLAACVLTGAGGNFSSGMDLKAFAHGERPVVENRGFAGFTECLPSKPLIAAVEGFAVAGGFEMVLACDLVVASKNTVFSLPEVERGLVAAGGGLLRLPERIPENIASEMILCGSRLDAPRAHDLGLVNVLTEPDEALSRAQEMACRIAQNNTTAVRVSKQVLLERRRWSPDEAFERQRSIIRPVMQSDAAHEGALAFTEQRTPSWSTS